MSGGITLNHCTAVHTAILMGEISDSNPISGELMAPFIEASRVDDEKTVLEAVYTKAKQAFSNACGATEDQINSKALKVRDAVSVGFLKAHEHHHAI